MKYNLANENEANAAFAYLTELVGKHELAEVIKVSPKRSLNQNSYLHLLLSAFGNHFGYTLEESKLIYKQLNAEIYEYTKKDRVFWRSSAELDKDEMAKSIDCLMQWSAKGGYPLPLATDQEWIKQIENEIERSKYYL